MYKADYSAVLYCAAKDFYEFAMTYRIEEAFKVKVYYIYVAVIDYTLSSSKCIMATFPRTEAIARLRELVLIDWGQRLADGLLHQTAITVGMPKRRRLPLSLGIAALLTGFGRYVPPSKELTSSSLLARSHGGSCSHDIRSTPPQPLFLTTDL